MPQVLTPQFTDKKWGRDYMARFDYLQHPIRDPGGNPVITYRHPGSGVSGSHRFVYGFPPDAGAHSFAEFVNLVKTAATDTHFDFCSIEWAQYALDVLEGKGKILVFPEVITEAQRAVIGLKQQLGALGGDPGRIVGFGECHGAYQLLLACCFMAPSATPAGGVLENRRIYQGRYYDSRLRGIINYAGNPLDLRRGLVSNVAAGFGKFSAASWTEGTKNIHAVGAFAHYDFQAGDFCVISAGTNATLATYSVASKIGSDDIRLTTSVGATASNLSGYTSCETYDPNQNIAYFGSDPAVNYNEWYALPQTLKTAASSIAYAAAGQLSFYVPLMHIYENAGTNNVPYGNLTEGGSDGHDFKQCVDLQAALGLRGINTQRIVFDRSAHPWHSDAYANANYNQPLYDFAVQCITS